MLNGKAEMQPYSVTHCADTTSRGDTMRRGDERAAVFVYIVYLCTRSTMCI